jgi:hypothetical protein
MKPSEPATHFGLARVYLALGKAGCRQRQYEVLRKLDARVARLIEPGFFSVW